MSSQQSYTIQPSFHKMPHTTITQSWWDKLSQQTVGHRQPGVYQQPVINNTSTTAPPYYSQLQTIRKLPIQPAPGPIRTGCGCGNAR
ncbi:MAG TPA: hypothetical protein VLG50_05330 [Candidatus Saccharimonadales bacterium]|nr:hypothetical protein [Candidatus Saccharimonadales bacterium]